MLDYLLLRNKVEHFLKKVHCLVIALEKLEFVGGCTRMLEVASCSTQGTGVASLRMSLSKGLGGFHKNFLEN